MNSTLRESTDNLDRLILNYINYDSQQSSKTEVVDQFYTQKFKEADLNGAEEIKTYAQIRPIVDKYLRELNDKKKHQQKSFSFETDTMDEQVVKQEMMTLGLKPEDYIIPIGSKQHVRISQEYLNWHHPRFANDAQRNSQPATLEQKYLKRNATDNGRTFEISSPNNIIPHLEQMSITVFSDNDNKIVDWPETLQLLQRYAKNNNYGKKQIKSALLRTITKYYSTDIPFYRDLSPDTIATKLIQSQPQINPKLHNLGRLKSLKRPVNMPLASVMQRAQSLIELMNPPCKENQTKNLNLFLASLISFTKGELRSNLQKYISERINSGQIINYVKLRNLAIEAETNDPTLIPDTELTFSQDINNKQSLGIFSIKTELETEELRNRRYKGKKYTRPMPIWVTNSKKPHVYWQNNDTSYQIDMEQLDNSIQKEVLKHEGNTHNFDNDKLIDDLSRQLESREVTDEKHEQAIYEGRLEKTKKDKLLRRINQEDDGPLNNVQTIANNIEQEIQNQNQQLENNQPPGVETRGMTKAKQQQNQQDQHSQSKVNVNYTSKVDHNMRDKTPSQNNQNREQDIEKRNSNYEKYTKDSYQSRNNHDNYKKDSYQSYSRSNNDKYQSSSRSNDRYNNQSNYRYNPRYNSRERSSESKYRQNSRQDSRGRYMNDRKYDSRNTANKENYRSRRDKYEYQPKNNRPYDHRYRQPSNDYRRNPRYTSTSRSTSRYNNQNRSYSRGSNGSTYRDNSKFNDRNRYSRSDYSRSRSGSYNSRSNSYNTSRNRPYNDRNRQQQYYSSRNSRSISQPRSYNFSNSYSRNQSAGRDRRSPSSYRQSRSPDRRFYGTSPSKSRYPNYNGNDSSPGGYRKDKDRYVSRDKRTNNKSQAWAMCLYKDMKPSQNCNKEYNPLESKMCSKCLSSNHHEFQCTKYTDYNPETCPNCNRGFHFAEDCKKGSFSKEAVKQLLNSDEFKQMIGKN